MVRKMLLYSILSIFLLVGCYSSAGAGGLNPRQPASPSASPAATSSSPMGGPIPAGSGPLPFNQHGANYKLLSSGEVALNEQPVDNRLEASFFSSSSAGWLIVGIGQGKLALLHTKDGGQNWKQQELPGEDGNAVYFHDDLHGVAMVQAQCKLMDGRYKCSTEQLLQTTDGGESWHSVWEEAGSVPDASWGGGELAFPDDAHGYAMTPDGKLLVTSDDGATWRSLSVGDKALHIEHISFVDENTGWVMGELQGMTDKGEPTGTLQLWKTVDGGEIWQKQFEQTGQGLGCSGLAFHDANSGYMIVSDVSIPQGGLLRTTDGGETWTQTIELPATRPSPFGIQLLSATEGWIPLSQGAGPIGGGLLHFSQGGTKVERIQNGPNSLRMATPTGHDSGWAISDEPTVGNTVLTTEDGGDSWKQVWPVPHPIADVTFLNDRVGFGIGRESEPGAFLQTTDGGKSWQVVSELGLSGYRLYFADRSRGWVLGTTDGGTQPHILQTTDGGITWRIITNTIPGWTSLPQYAELRFDSDTEGKLIIQQINTVRVLRTVDGGRAWNSGPAEKLSNPVALATDGNEDNVLAASLQSLPDKTHWLQLTGYPMSGNGSDGTLLGKWIVEDTPEAAIAPSAKTFALLTLEIAPGKTVLHLISTADGGETWRNRSFPNVSASIDSPFRLGAYSNEDWWLLSRRHLLLTHDAGANWSLQY